MSEFDSRIKELSGSAILVVAVTDLLVEGKSVDECAKFMDIDRDVVLVIRDMETIMTKTFCDYLTNRGVISLDVEFDKAIELAKMVKDSTHAQRVNFNKKFEVYRRNNTTHGESYFLMKAYNVFAKYLLEGMAELADMSSKKNPSIMIPRELVSVVADMSMVEMNILIKACFTKRVLKMTIDRKEIKHVINGYKPRATDTSLIKALVKCGANYAFIKEYVGTITVEFTKVNKWRDVYGVDNEPQVLNIREAGTAWSLYMQLTGAGLSTVDVYFQMYRKMGAKYRIDTLWNSITRMIEEQFSDEDEEDDELDVMMGIKK